VDWDRFDRKRKGQDWGLGLGLEERGWWVSRREGKGRKEGKKMRNETNENVVQSDSQIEDLLVEGFERVGFGFRGGGEGFEERFQSSDELLSFCLC